MLSVDDKPTCVKTVMCGGASTRCEIHLPRAFEVRRLIKKEKGKLERMDSAGAPKTTTLEGGEEETSKSEVRL